MKKMVSLCCAALLLLNSAFAAGIEDHFPTVKSYNGFHDVATGVWYEDAVRITYETGLLEGTGAGFQPSGTLTIGESAAAAARLHEILTGATGTLDAAGNGAAWYSKYITYLKVLGVTGLDKPTEPVSRYQFFNMLATVLSGEPLEAINAISKLPDTTDATIIKLYNAGLLTGKDKYGTFAGNDTLTRAELAATLARTVRPALRVTFTPEEKPGESVTQPPPVTDDISMASYLLNVKDHETLATVGDHQVPANLMLFFLHTVVFEEDTAQMEQYGSGLDWTRSYNGISDLGAFFKQQALRDAVEYYAMPRALELAGVTFSAADEQQVQSIVAQSYADMGGAVAAAANLRALGLTSELYTELVRNEVRYEKLDEAMQRTTDKALLQQYLDSNGYLAAKHILVADETTANQIYEQLVNNPTMSNFDVLMTAHTLDSAGLAQNPNGYLFYDGEMVPIFEATTKSLAVGKFSKPVASTYGYHIILRLEAKNHPAAWEVFRASAADFFIYQATAEIYQKGANFSPFMEALDVEEFYKGWVSFANQVLDSFA